VLQHLDDAGFPFRLCNGYLEVPRLAQDKHREALEAFGEQLHTLRPLVMEDVEASGLDTELKAFTKGSHRANLVYASAVPVDNYLNIAEDDSHRKLMEAVAKLVLIAQYYGALQHAAAQSRPHSGKRLVYLMPLGGGVFCNPPELIATAMSCALELLTPEELEVLDVHVLTFRGLGDGAKEARVFQELLSDRGKLRGDVQHMAPTRRVSLEDSQPEVPLVVPSGPPPLTCAFCGRGFSSKTLLKLHARRAHPEAQ